MSIPLLAQATTSNSLIISTLTVAVVSALAFAAGVYRRKSIVGPPRIAPGEPISIIWMLLLLGFGVWIMVPMSYGMLKFARQGIPPTTAPTTKSADAFSPEEMVILGLASAGVALVAMLIANRVTRPNAFDRLGLTGQTFARVPKPALVAILLVLPLMFAAGEYTQYFWQIVGLEHPNAHPLLRIFGEGANSGLRAMVVISAIFFAPFFEELLFRGHLQTALLYSIQWLIRSEPAPAPIGVPGNPQASPLPVAAAEDSVPSPWMRWMAILITSFFFTLVHGEIWMMPPIFLLSLCLGYVYERTGNLWASIVLHGAFNAANVALFILQSGQA